jgi:hypothetical protein
VLPTCQALESFSLTPLMMLQQSGAPGSGLGTCQRPEAAEVLASYNFVAVGCVLPALIAFWHERHFKSKRASCACLCIAGGACLGAAACGGAGVPLTRPLLVPAGALAACTGALGQRHRRPDERAGR